MARARRTGTARSTSKSTTSSTASTSTAAAKPQTSATAASSFVCPECGRTFARPAALGAHRRRVHNVAGARSTRTARSTAGRRRATRTAPARTPSTALVPVASASIDRDYDAADTKAGKKISCPVLALWSAEGGLQNWYEDEGGPLKLWQTWADNVSGGPVAGGHFFPEESPRDTAAALQEFMKRGN